MKTIAFYLPQYYTFPENDEWWGKGFTEWTNVRKAKPLYKGHVQPKVPKDENYYTLDKPEVMKWQIELAKNAGIAGFCFYHYWFRTGKMLMEKPVEMYLNHTELDFPFCICWANHNWARTWTGGDKDILISVEYGVKEDWKAHFDYLYSYFKDTRYIKEGNSPVVVIYMPNSIPDGMMEYWNQLAIEKGFDGITYISQHQGYLVNEKVNKNIQYSIQYEPDFSRLEFVSNLTLKKWLVTFAECPAFARCMLTFYLRKGLYHITGKKIDSLKWMKFDYDAVWERILSRKVNEDNRIPCAFVNYDTSPRKGANGTVYVGYTPEKFGKYFARLLEKAQKEYHSNYVFIMAWNEWGEGAYLEPDEEYGDANLRAVRSALEKMKVEAKP